jgi:hypothetical protein
MRGAHSCHGRFGDRSDRRSDPRNINQILTYWKQTVINFKWWRGQSNKLKFVGAACNSGLIGAHVLEHIWLRGLLPKCFHNGQIRSKSKHTDRDLTQKGTNHLCR